MSSPRRRASQESTSQTATRPDGVHDAVPVDGDRADGEQDGVGRERDHPRECTVPARPAPPADGPPPAQASPGLAVCSAHAPCRGDRCVNSEYFWWLAAFALVAARRARRRASRGVPPATTRRTTDGTRQDDESAGWSDEHRRTRGRPDARVDRTPQSEPAATGAAPGADLPRLRPLQRAAEDRRPLRPRGARRAREHAVPADRARRGAPRARRSCPPTRMSRLRRSCGRRAPARRRGRCSTRTPGRPAARADRRRRPSRRRCAGATTAIPTADPAPSCIGMWIADGSAMRRRADSAVAASASLRDRSAARSERAIDPTTSAVPPIARTKTAASASTRTAAGRPSAGRRDGSGRGVESEPVHPGEGQHPRRAGRAGVLAGVRGRGDGQRRAGGLTGSAAVPPQLRHERERARAQLGGRLSARWRHRAARRSRGAAPAPQCSRRTRRRGRDAASDTSGSGVVRRCGGRVAPSVRSADAATSADRGRRARPRRSPSPPARSRSRSGMSGAAMSALTVGGLRVRRQVRRHLCERRAETMERPARARLDRPERPGRAWSAISACVRPSPYARTMTRRSGSGISATARASVSRSSVAAYASAGSTDEAARASSEDATIRSSASSVVRSVVAGRRAARRPAVGVRPRAAGRPTGCARSSSATCAASRGATSNVSARFHSARNVSCTTSSATCRSPVSLTAAANTTDAWRSYASASASADPPTIRATSAPSSGVGVQPSSCLYVGHGRPVSSILAANPVAGTGSCDPIVADLATSPPAGRCWGRPRRRRRAGAPRGTSTPAGPDDGVVPRAGREIEPVARRRAATDVSRSGRPKTIDPRATTSTLS